VKFGVRFHFNGPSPRKLAEYIPVFHGWIQRQALPEHLLIDVHDYSHVPGGPGILLVAHEANISVDTTGLTYTRKQPAPLPEVLIAAGQAAELLGERRAAGYEVFTNDRLSATNDDAGAAQWLPVVQSATGGQVSRKRNDPRERLTFSVAT